MKRRGCNWRSESRGTENAIDGTRGLREVHIPEVRMGVGVPRLEEGPAPSLSRELSSSRIVLRISSSSSLVGPESLMDSEWRCDVSLWADSAMVLYSKGITSSGTASSS